MLVSQEYSGEVLFPPDNKRLYFFAVQTVGDATIEFGEGGGLIPLVELNHIAPSVIPLDTISIISTGSFVVLATQATHDAAL